MNRPQVATNNLLSIQQSIDRLLRKLSMLAGGNTFVFRPGSLRHENVYPLWPELVIAAAAVEGPKLVLFDDYFAPCVVPAGTWDFQGQTTFTGKNTGPVFVTFDDGARLIDVFGFFLLTIPMPVSPGSNPLIQTADYSANGPLVFTFGARTTVEATPGGAQGGMINHNGTTPICLVQVQDDARFVNPGGGASPLHCQTRNAILQIMGYDNADIGNATLSTAQFANIIGLILSPGAQIDPSQGPWNVSRILANYATRMAYDDSVSPPLSASDVQAAIDVIKQVVGSYVGNRILSGNISPVGVVVGDIGDLYVDRSGFPNPTLYVKQSNSGGTGGWAAK